MGLQGDIFVTNKDDIRYIYVKYQSIDLIKRKDFFNRSPCNDYRILVDFYKLTRISCITLYL